MALYFRGGSWNSDCDHLYLQNAVVNCGSEPFTLSWWAWFSTAANYYDHFFQLGMLGNVNENGAYNPHGGLNAYISGIYSYQGSFRLRGNGTDASGYVWWNTQKHGTRGENKIFLNRWHHFCIVGDKNASESNGRFYLDGNLLQDNYAPSRTFTYSLVDNPHFYIGKAGVETSNTGTRPHVGAIAEVSYFNSNLDHKRCRALMTEDPRAMGSSALQFYMPLREGAPRQIYGAQAGSITVNVNQKPSSCIHPPVNIAAQQWAYRVPLFGRGNPPATDNGRLSLSELAAVPGSTVDLAYRMQLAELYREILVAGGAAVVSPGAIASAEAVGTPAASPGTATVSPGGIASGEAVGTPTMSAAVTVSPSGIASGEASGIPTAAPGAVTVSPGGIASGEATGTPTASPGGVTVSPSGVASVEAAGTPTATAGGVTVSPGGVASAEVFGTPTATPGSATVSPGGIASSEAVGTPTAQQTTQVSPGSIPSAEAFGTPTATPGTATVSPGGIATGEQFGTPQAQGGAVTVSPGGIASQEATGTPTAAGGAITVSPGGIASGEAAGTPTASPGAVTVSPGGIASGEATGTPTITQSAALVQPGSIASGEAFGTPTASGGVATVSPGGITSAEAAGTPTATAAVTVLPGGIVSGEGEGTPTITPGTATVLPTGVPSAEEFGAMSVSTAILAAAQSMTVPARAAALVARRRVDSSFVPGRALADTARMRNQGIFCRPRVFSVPFQSGGV